MKAGRRGVSWDKMNEESDGRVRYHKRLPYNKYRGTVSMQVCEHQKDLVEGKRQETGVQQAALAYRMSPVSVVP